MRVILATAIIGAALLQGCAYPVMPMPPMPMAAPASAPYRVLFAWNRADLNGEALQIIRQAAAASGNARIEVLGYTDTSGQAPYNEGLSIRRARAVAAELVHIGVPQGAISIHGFGETQPLVPTGNNVREPLNRRVEIIIQHAVAQYPAPPIYAPVPMWPAPYPYVVRPPYYGAVIIRRGYWGGYGRPYYRPY